MNVRQALEHAKRILELHTCEGSDAKREAEELLAFSLGMDRSGLLSGNGRELAGPEQARLAEVLSRRLEHEPMARILGAADFLGHNFLLDRSTLVPRPATEIIVSKAIERIGTLKKVMVLDVGTGSGCIAVSIALELPGAEVVAIDISPEALETASRR
jgi:release factor glutamine methyltransferase